MPDLTLSELDELERLAKAATPGDLDTVNDPADEYGGKSAAAARAALSPKDTGGGE